MSIANDIINGRIPDFERYLRNGESLDDLDEYGFTPLIECAITGRVDVAEQLLERGVDVNKGDVTNRTPLHWAVDNSNYELIKLLLQKGANPNAYTNAGLSILVYPILREQTPLKHLLYQHGAKLDFPLDFIQGKLIGHRFELQGDVDIVTAAGEFIELDYEGFILEFTVEIINDSLKRFTSSYSTRNLRSEYPYWHTLIDSYSVASEFLKLQHQQQLSDNHKKRIQELLKTPLLVFPAASQGHAMGFVKYKNWWAKIDRGENSLKEGCINIYRITRPEQVDLTFVLDFLFKRQPRQFFHETINRRLGLLPVSQIPISAQISGNCSWANIQAAVLVGLALQKMTMNDVLEINDASRMYNAWIKWDQDRAIDECIQRFYHASPARKASMAAMLANILFQVCHYDNEYHMIWAEKILTILVLPKYSYILKSYLTTYCGAQGITVKGNNLLKMLDECGVDPTGF